VINNSTRGGFNPGCTMGCGVPGSAWGGAIYTTNGTVELRDCTLSTNRTVPGSPVKNYVGGAAGGGALYVGGGTLTLVSTLLSLNQCTGSGGNGYGTEGDGGAILNLGQLLITNCTFVGNSVTGGSGRNNGIAPGTKPGNGGALCNFSTATILATTFEGNTASGGDGVDYSLSLDGATPGASGNGGAVYSTGTVAMVNCTLFRNGAWGGDGSNDGLRAPTSGGPGNGGGIFVSSGSFAVTNLTFTMNSAQGGIGGTFQGTHASDGSSLGGAVYVATGATAIAVNTILANSLSGSNCFGTLTDAGHNHSSDASCYFTTAGSLNNTDPKLGPFGDYGGPTATVPLLSGSPAIDAADAFTCPATDQRGISRPYGAGCDIGAFESAPPYTVNGHIHGYLNPGGVVVNVGSNSVPVDASGFYTFTGLTPGTYLVNPDAAETRSVPGRRAVQLGPDSTGIDFNAYRMNALAAETSANRDAQVVFAGEFEGTYRTEVSTNLIDWSLYSTNRTDTNGLFLITNLYFGSGNPTFLRVVKP